MVEPESYATSYSPGAKAVYDGLAVPLRAAVLDIEDELAENPDKYPARLIPLPGNAFIYKHPKPAIELMCRIDREHKTIDFVQLTVPTLTVSKTLFISYSHKDEKWLLELKKWLTPLEQSGRVALWDDEQIKASADWRRDINEALASANAAVLLISIDFLTSEFILNHELPQLLNAAQERGMQVLWIAVRESMVDDTEIVQYQAVHKDPPLALLPRPRREVCFHNIYKRIKEVVDA